MLVLIISRTVVVLNLICALENIFDIYILLVRYFYTDTGPVRCASGCTPALGRGICENGDPERHLSPLTPLVPT